MEEEDNVFINIFEKLLLGNQTWQLVPSNNFIDFSAEYNDITEMYFTNKDTASWSEIANKEVQKTTFLVGKYLTRYYYEEDEYTVETNYFFGFAKKITTERIVPESCMTISDSSFEPIVMDGNYKVIRDLFNKAKKSTFDFSDILNELD